MNLKHFFVFPLLLTGCLSVYAETANMRSVSDTPAGVSLPRNGMSMDAVMQQFGEPDSKISPVGEPPITRWSFPQYTVYFEHNLVIHSVAHR